MPSGGGAIAEAAVDLVADGSKFSPSVSKALSAAGSAASKAGAQAGTFFGTSFGAKLKNVATYTGIKDAVQLGFGAVTSGIAKVIETGIGYQNTMATLGVVTKASGSQMQAAGALAQTLGRDMGLPGVTAEDAADALLDLAKSGQPLNRAMASVRSTLQLETAAHLDAATAAQIQGDTMDIFALKSGQASHAADVLANTITNTSGDITDLYTGLKYVGPVAHSLGIGLDDTATAMAEMGKSGILGSMAGTTLRSMLTRLSAPSKQAQGALNKLGVEAFNNQGKFVGLRSVIGQLQVAQGRMTQQQFQMYASLAFGQESMSGVIALTHDGVDGFDKMATAVGRQGGAAKLSAAQNTGLSRTFANLKQVASDLALRTFQAVAPALLSVGSTVTRGLSTIGPQVSAVLTPAAHVLGSLAQVAGSVLGPALAVLGPALRLVAAAANSPAFRTLAIMFLAGAAAMKIMALAMDADLLVVRAWEIATKLATGAQAAFDAVMDANPIMIIVVALAALAAGFAYLWTHSAGFRAFWINLWSGVKSVFSAVVNWLIGAFKSVASFLATWGPLILAVIAPFIGIPLLIITHWRAILSFFEQLGPVLGHFFASLGSAVASGVSAVLSWFAALPGRVGSFLAALPGIVGSALLTALRVGLIAAVQGLEWIIAALIAFPADAAIALAHLGVALYNALAAAWQWAKNATIQAVLWLATQAVLLPGRIVSGLATLGARLLAWAISAWNSARTGFVSGVLAVVNFALSLPGRIVSAVVSLAGRLAAWARSAWNSARSGFVSGVAAVISFAASLPGRVVSAIASLAGRLRTAAVNGFHAMVSGGQAAQSAILGFVRSIPGRIVSALGSLGHLLLGAGKAIINGLLAGLKAAVGALWSFISGIGNKISRLKGPLPYDRQLLVPHGKAIIGGLDRGMRTAFGTVRRTLRRFTREIPDVPVRLRGDVAAGHPAAGFAAYRSSELAAAMRNANAFASSGGSRTSHRETHVNAPVTVVVPNADPVLAGMAAADQVANSARI